MKKVLKFDGANNLLSIILYYYIYLLLIIAWYYFIHIDINYFSKQLHSVAVKVFQKLTFICNVLLVYF